MHSIVDIMKREKLLFGLILCFVLPPIGILFLFIIGFLSFYKSWRGKQHLSFSLASLFFLCLLISTVFAAYQMENLALFVSSLMVIGYWGLYTFIRNNGSMVHFHQYKWIIIFGGIYNCLIGWLLNSMDVNPILGFLTGTIQLGESDHSRLFGSSYNSNFAMYLILIAIAFLFGEIQIRLRNKNYNFLYWQILMVLVLSYGVFTTGSRAGYATLIILYLLFFFRLNKWVFVTIAGLLLVLAKQVYMLMPRKDIIDISANVRENIWTNSIDLWKQHFFFGTTPLGFRGEYFKFFNDDMIHAHNLFIGFFVEYGIIGGIAFLTVFSITGYKAISLFFSKKHSNELLEYFLLSLPIIVLTGILDEPTFSPQIALPTIVLLSYWGRYTRNFSLAFLPFPAAKLKKT